MEWCRKCNSSLKKKNKRRYFPLILISIRLAEFRPLLCDEELHGWNSEEVEIFRKS